jgi:ankyrin repeat protein
MASNVVLHRHRFLPFSALALSVALAGCQQVSHVLPNTPWHQKFSWKADAYFTDPQVIALCKAIEADDIAEIDRLVAAGADVNAKGKGNMTPLMWAFPDNKLARFTRLLEHGANPNVVIQSDFNTRGGISSGDSVTHMACRTEFPGYFEAVFAHGGDPNFVRNWLTSGLTPLFSVITGRSPNKIAHVTKLIELGANLDQVDGTGTTPVMQANGRGFYNLALILLLESTSPKLTRVSFIAYSRRSAEANHGGHNKSLTIRSC